MISLRKKDDNFFYLEYTGELNAKHNILRVLASSSNNKRIDTDNWIIDSQTKSILESNYSIEYITVPWENVGAGLKYTPYDYQKEYVHFGSNNDNALFLAGTGAGKTFIAITLYNELKLAGKITKPGIIVVPASLKYQWTKEVSKFSDLVAHSIDTPSKMKKKFDAQFEDCDLLICNYETLKNKQVSEKLLNMELEFMLIDEVQALGNYKSARSKAVYQFNDLQYKYGMTATPITRDPSNLFGIFNFINPNVFKSHGKFATNYLIYRSYGQVSGVKNVDHLKAQIAPYVFMKSEEEIASQLPELIVTPIYCTMSTKTKKINDTIMKDLKAAKDAVEAIEKKITNPKLLEINPDYLKFKAQVLAYQTFAQELADDPRLIGMSESNMTSSYKVDDLDSPKLDVLLDLIEEIIDADETVCIFTKYERMQRILTQEISKHFKDIDVAYLNGSMSSEERYEQAYTKFQGDNNCKVLIMTEAGQAGVSLSKCKNLIEYDLADSYAGMTQRHGRVKRADSVSKVSNVYQIILEESYDEIALKIINKKQRYDNDIIKSLKE
jgi:SNF2 family DNA or RNA helicase